MTLNSKIDLEWIFKFTLFLCVATLPIYATLCNQLLVTASALGCLLFFKERKLNLTPAVLLLLMFLCYIFSISYSQNLAESMHSLELGSSYFFIPLIFILGGHLITKQFSDDLLKIFAAAVLLICTISYLRIVFQTGQFYPSGDQDTYTYYDPFSRYSFANFIHFHPTYLSMYLLFVVIIVFEKITLNVWIKVLITLLIAFYLLILSAKNQLLLFLPLIAFIAWKQTSINRIKKIVSICLIVTLFIFLGYNNVQIRYRFQNEFTTATGDRSSLWQSGVSIIKQNILLGVGIGDNEDVLNETLLKNNQTELVGYNLHNQYLDYTLSFGLLGLSIFLIILAMPIFYKVDFTFKMFLFIVAASAMTESILDRQKGLCFFIIFYGLLSCGYSLWPKKDLTTTTE